MSQLLLTSRSGRESDTKEGKRKFELEKEKVGGTRRERDDDADDDDERV